VAGLKLAFSDGKLTVGASWTTAMTQETSLPAPVTVVKEINDPGCRPAKLKARKAIPVWGSTRMMAGTRPERLLHPGGQSSCRRPGVSEIWTGARGTGGPPVAALKGTNKGTV
jgi:hypothetical protein